ncbi:MAG: beta-ketoacyl-ACP reductase [Melioribacteraceae bacterium]|nr:MAG: beta-ketoacyl-ACP reductase [Melioribacteraceae bacterium]
MIDLSNKIVFITGGSKGIGEACVKLFCEVHAKVIFTYNSDEEEAEKIQKAYGAADIYKMDVGSEDDVNYVVESIASKYGRVDILVNNAGIWEGNELEKITLEQWERTQRTNLTGTFLVTKAIVPLMKKNKFGKIINISSTASQRGEAYYSLYAASKGGINAFTKSLSTELGPFGINVNAVAPGWVMTPMTAKVFEDKKYLEQETNKIPLRRIATPEDIAGPVLFLASELSRNITGAVISANGGSILCG